MRINPLISPTFAKVKQESCMLKQLYIRNYALFEETHVEFPHGLNILTGETGAGKSMLIGALGLINGKRADNSVIFHHEDKCIVEARFGELSPNLKKRLSGYEDFDIEEEELIIRREIRPSGKSRAFINDTPVSLQVLREVSSTLLDMHGQNESLTLLAPEKQIELVDSFADMDSEVAKFGEKLKTGLSIEKEIKALVEKEAEASQKLEYINFQIQELEAAGIQADEEEQLEQELNLLQNAEEVKESLGGATELLYHQELSIYNQLSEGIDQLKKIENVSTKIAEEVSRLVEAQNTIKESAFLFQDLLETTESDPERLAFIEERLAVYHNLRLKYNAKSGAELVELYESLSGQLHEFNSLEETINLKKEESEAIKKKLVSIGLKIEAGRIKAKVKMEKDIIDFLSNVGFNKSRFEVAVERIPGDENDLFIDGAWVKASPRGINKVYFVIQTNPGMPAGPVSQVASGGEVSRVMLAIKAALADKSEFPVLIFDEIDSGISGEIAHKVGNVMLELAKRFQIISITHLPQIAGKGNHHFQIYKEVRDNKTVSNVNRLDETSRINELAKMISGDQPSESALENARN